LHKNELIQRISNLLDKQIIGNYKLHKTNRIAYDILHDHNENNEYYENEDREKFIRDIEGKAASMSGDKDELTAIFLDMYARPYQNQKELFHGNNNKK